LSSFFTGWRKTGTRIDGKSYGTPVRGGEVWGDPKKMMKEEGLKIDSIADLGLQGIGNEGSKSQRLIGGG